MVFFLHIFRDIEWIIFAILMLVLFGAIIFGIVKCLQSNIQFKSHAITENKMLAEQQIDLRKTFAGT